MTTPRSEFMLLLRQPATGPGPTPEELQAIMEKFRIWMEGLHAHGAVAGTNGLEATGKVLRGSRGAVITDGPYAEATEVIGGYVMVYAASLDEAVEIARGCPGLDHRLAVEVRPVRHVPGRSSCGAIPQ